MAYMKREAEQQGIDFGVLFASAIRTNHLSQDQLKVVAEMFEKDKTHDKNTKKEASYHE